MTAHMKPIDTAKMSGLLRGRSIDVSAGIPPRPQPTSPVCPTNPLPIAPACKALGLDPPSVMTAQVFQNAACAWRCWFCFVPYNLLSADPKRGEWLTAEDLVQLYRKEPECPFVIDLSGGSPDLVPEWTPWMMRALADAGLDSSTYLWTDDNLS